MSTTVSTTILSAKATSPATMTQTEIATERPATMTLTAATTKPTNQTQASIGAKSSVCSECGSYVDATRFVGSSDDSTGHAAYLQAKDLQQARQQIRDLEAQVRLLNQKAAAAVDRWADYEDELAKLRRQPSEQATTATPIPASPSAPPPPVRSSFLPAGAASRISALLSPRAAKSTPNLKKLSDASAATIAAATSPPPPPPRQTLPGTPPPLSATATAYSHSTKSSYSSSTAASSPATTALPPPPPPPPKTAAAAAAAASSMQALLAALSHEKTLRRQAESRLNDTSREVEELSVSLFEQANEMVAEERRQRARLEQRVAVLEQRDTDKRRRLEQLEQAMGRIDRVRALLGQTVLAVVAGDKMTAETTSKTTPEAASGTASETASETAAEAFITEAAQESSRDSHVSVAA